MDAAQEHLGPEIVSHLYYPAKGVPRAAKPESANIPLCIKQHTKQSSTGTGDFCWGWGNQHLPTEPGSLNVPLFLITYKLNKRMLERISPYTRKHWDSDSFTCNIKWKDEKPVLLFSVTSIQGLSTICSVLLYPAQTKKYSQRRWETFFMN